MSRHSVLRILHRNKFHAYHISLHQELHGQDFVNRIRFCEWVLAQLAENLSLLSHVLFTDEAEFTNHGQLNKHNMHYWASKNPYWLRAVEHQRQWTVNVWCGILGDNIIGPYFIDGTLNGHKYAEFLTEVLPVLLHDVRLDVRLKMWYQHDGCPAHWAGAPRMLLHTKFPHRWIGRGGPIQWPARSPDITPLDFFLWGTLKDIVYRNVPTTADNMRQRIVDGVQQLRRR